MSDFINTIDALGDDVVMDSIIDRTITEFKDDKLTTIGGYAFFKCAALTTIELPNVATLGQSCFQESGIVDVCLPAATNLGLYPFSGCKALKRAVFPKATNIGTYSMANCTSLEKVEFGSTITISSQLFMKDAVLTCLILRSESLCALSNANAFKNTPVETGAGCIYVPRALLSDDDETKDYRRATNWSTYAAKFRALEDYTVDGTVTGELDETKI